MAFAALAEESPQIWACHFFGVPFSGALTSCMPTLRGSTPDLSVPIPSECLKKGMFKGECSALLGIIAVLLGVPRNCDGNSGSSNPRDVEDPGEQDSDSCGLRKASDGRNHLFERSGFDVYP